MPSERALIERLHEAADAYEVQADAVLSGGAVWAGASHYLDIAALLREAAAVLVPPVAAPRRELK